VTAPADARTRGTSVVDVFGEQFDIDARPDPERGELMVHRLRPVSRQWTGTRDT